MDENLLIPKVHDIDEEITLEEVIDEKGELI